MKKIILWGIVAVVCFDAQAQPDIKRDDKASVDSLLHLDFQVPDNPAFKTLGIDPSEVLRPSEIKDLAMLVAPGLSKNLALEWSPGRIRARNKKWKLTDYDSSGVKRAWVNSAFSAGTKVEEGEGIAAPFQLGIGYRVQFLSEKADPLRNPEFKTRIDAFNNSRRKIRVYYAEEVLKKSCAPGDASCRYKDSDLTVGWLIRPRTALERQDSSDFVDWVAHVDTTTLSQERKEQVKEVRKNSLKSILKDLRSSTWNARRFDMAVAWSGRSKDSTLDALSYNSLHLWATLSLPLGKHGQVLLGGTFVNTLDADSLGVTQVITGNGRAYYGAERIKGFVELQYKQTTYDRDQDPTAAALLLSLGLEAKIIGNLGVVASTGIENYLDVPDPYSALRSNLNLRYYLR